MPGQQGEESSDDHEEGELGADREREEQEAQVTISKLFELPEYGNKGASAELRGHLGKGKEGTSQLSQLGGPQKQGKEQGAEGDHSGEATPDVSVSSEEESEQAFKEDEAFSQGDLEEGEVEEDDEGEQIDEDIGRGVSSNQMEEIPNEEGVRGNWRLLGWSWKLVAEQPYNRYITFSLEKRDAVDPREGSKLDADMVPEELPLPRFAQPAKDDEDLGDSSEEESEDKGRGSEQKGEPRLHSKIERPDSWYYYNGIGQQLGPFEFEQLEMYVNSGTLPQGICAFRPHYKEWRMLGKKPPTSEVAISRVLGQLHNAALKTARHWLLDVPIHEALEDCLREAVGGGNAIEEAPLQRRSALSKKSMPAAVAESRTVDELLQYRRPRGFAQMQRTLRQSQKQEEKPGRKRAFDGVPRVDVSQKHRRIDSEETRAWGISDEEYKLDFSSSLPVHLLARCLLALGDDETSLARASAVCRAWRVAYGSALNEKEREAVRENSRKREFSDILHRTLDKVHKAVWSEDSSGIFREPVAPEEAPHYHEIIQHPMDLSTMRRRLQGRHYTPESGGLEAFKSDLRLIFDNCRKYNQPDSFHYKEAERLQQFAESKLQSVHKILRKRLWEALYRTKEEKNDPFVASILADYRKQRKAGIRHFDHVEDYVCPAAEDEVKLARQVDLPDEDRRARHSDKRESWWPSEDKKAHRLALDRDVVEQETYGIDHQTARNVIEQLPSEMTAEERWNFIESTLMPALNRVYGTLPPSDRRTQTLTMVMEDISVDLLKHNDPESRRLASATRVIARVAAKDPINFAVHRKGCGVLCNAKKGIPNDTMVVDFLGELYPPWRWHEKQDAVKDVQRRQWQDEHLPESTEFYNMQLERPKGDGKGYGLLFVDAMHRTNYSARLAHSCSPNVEVRVKATGGKYRIHFYTLRHVEPGEELCYDYNTVTDSEEEQKAAFCLCGMRSCRWSFLSLVGENAYMQVMFRKHRFEHRQALLLQCCRDNVELSQEELSWLDQVGLVDKMGALADLPPWARRFVARVANFLLEERKELPAHLVQLQPEGGDDVGRPYTELEAEVESDGVHDSRLASLAASLSKIRMALVTNTSDSDATTASTPFRYPGNAEVVASVIGEGGAMAKLLERAEECYGASCDRLRSQVQSITLQAPSDELTAPQFFTSLRAVLEELGKEANDERHAAAADLAHLYACTELFFVPKQEAPYTVLESEEIPVREDEVTAGVGAQGASREIIERYRKRYGAQFIWGQLVHWHQHLEDPAAALDKRRRGLLALPPLHSPYEFQGQNAAREAREKLLEHLELRPFEPWPEGYGWSWQLSNESGTGFHGSPCLDAALNGVSELPDACLSWLRSRIRS